MSELPLFSLLGNRFNILFLNGPGTFSICMRKLADFFQKINLNNKGPFNYYVCINWVVF